MTCTLPSRPRRGSTRDGLGLADHSAVLRPAARTHLVGGSDEPGHRRRLLSRQPQPGLVHRRGVHLRLQHRLRAPRRSRRRGRDERRGPRPLRAARVVSARARLGVRSVLLALDGVHDARVSGAALLSARALGALHHFPRGLRADQVRGRHLRGRRRLRHAAAGGSSAPLRRDAQRVLGRLGSCGCPDGDLHHRGRHARRGIHRRGANHHSHHGIRADHRVRPGAARRLARAPRRIAFGHVQSLEAAHSSRYGRHVGAGAGDLAHRLVLQRPFPLAWDAVLRAHRRPVVLDDRPVHRAARARRPE